MRIVVFGLGHVGLVTAVLLASKGHEIVGVEIDDKKIESLNKSSLFFYEPFLSELFKNLPKSLFSVKHFTEDLNFADVFMVCVGTPALKDGSVDLSQCLATTSKIANKIASIANHSQVIYRSTFPPDTVSEKLIPLLEKESGKVSGRDFSVYYFPEFMREGCAVEDFNSPSLNLWGTNGNEIPSFYKGMGISIPPKIVSFKTAEMIKYMSNSFHAMKVAVANEFGLIASQMGVDTTEVFDVFLSDSKLNISKNYLSPGFAFGGSCLTKDLRGLLKMAENQHLAVPLLESITVSNEQHVQRAIRKIERLGKTKIGFSGVGFKPKTSDLRFSPVFRLAEHFAFKSKDSLSYAVKIFDPLMSASLKLRSMERMDNFEVFLNSVDLVVLGNHCLNDEQLELIVNRGQSILDLSFFPIPSKIRNYSRYSSLYLYRNDSGMVSLHSEPAGSPC